jgi:hypothetical protein
MFPKEQLNFLDFDIYSRRISFFYQNKEKIGSSLGFMLTVLYAMISLALFLFYLIKSLKREEMTASDSTIYPTNYPYIDINNDIFYLAFGLEHPNKLMRYIDERIYYPEVVFIERTKEAGAFTEIKKTNLNFERCNYLKFGKDYQNLFQKEEVYNSYCLKDFNLTLGGGFKYDKISYLRINIYPCVNNSENNNHCLPQSEIDYYLTSTYFSVLARDIGLNPSNYSFPALPIMQDIRTNIDKSVMSEFILYFGIAEIDTDMGLFSSQIKKDTYLKYVNSYHSIYYYDNNKNVTKKEILSAQIRLQDNIYFQKRTYIKMSQVLSITGGYMQVISTIFSIISLLTKKISLEKKLLNSLFNFNIRQKKIILCIEYEKKLDYNSPMNKRKSSTFIPYEAKKSIISNIKNRRKSIFIYNKKDRDIQPIMKRKISQDHPSIKNIKMQSPITKDGIFGIIKRLSKSKLNNQINNNNSNIHEQSINRSKVDMINKEDNLNDNQLNKIFEEKKERSNPKTFSDFNLINDYRLFDRGNISTINFNLFDYYCLRKITKKKTEIELFRFGINFYKSQMDIINFFNIMFLTQIMLAEQSEKKQNFLTQKIELSIN